MFMPQPPRFNFSPSASEDPLNWRHAGGVASLLPSVELDIRE